MPTKKKSSKKGKKHPDEKAKRTLELKEELEEYALIEKILGNGRVSVIYTDSRKILAHVRGSLKRCRMAVGDVVLVSIREFQQNKCDIIHKYEKTEVNKLLSLGEIPPNFLSIDNSFGNEDNEGDDVIFEETETETETETSFEFDNI